MERFVFTSTFILMGRHVFALHREIECLKTLMLLYIYFYIYSYIPYVPII